MMSRNVFIFLGVFSFIVTMFSSVLLFVKDANSVDMLSYVKKDCVPYNVFVQKGQQEYSAKIIWSTKANCLGFVLYGNDSNTLDLVAVDLINSSRSKNHEVTIEKILNSENYYFLVNSADQSYGLNGSPIMFSLKNL